MIRIDDIHKSFGPVEVLRGLTMEVARGEVVSVVGASGAGKTTLLQIMGTLLRPDSGRVEIGGRDPFALDDRELSRFRNERIGFVFQFHHLLPEFSTEENVAMQALIAGMNRSKALGLARQALERVGLSDRKDHRVTTLSGGERQRAAIARAILLEPRVLLADEPTGNLDQRTGDSVAELLLELNRTLGMTLVIVTHNREMAGTLGRCLELRSGELYEEMRTRAAGAGAV